MLSNMKRHISSGITSSIHSS